MYYLHLSASYAKPGFGIKQQKEQQLRLLLQQLYFQFFYPKGQGGYMVIHININSVFLNSPANILSVPDSQTFDQHLTANRD